MSVKITPMSDRDSLLIKTAVLSFRSALKKRLALVDGKKVFETPIEFSLGELRKAIRSRFGTSTPTTREAWEVLGKYKDEVVVIA